MAYGARLESVLGASPRGFESPILRHAYQHKRRAVPPYDEPGVVGAVALPVSFGVRGGPRSSRPHAGPRHPERHLTCWYRAAIDVVEQPKRPITARSGTPRAAACTATSAWMARGTSTDPAMTEGSSTGRHAPPGNEHVRGRDRNRTPQYGPAASAFETKCSCPRRNGRISGWGVPSRDPGSPVLVSARTCVDSVLTPARRRRGWRRQATPTIPAKTTTLSS